MSKEELLEKAYALFNSRKADELLQLMTPDVHWPNGWEGGYVNGRDEVKAYWLRQWKELNPHVLPEAFRHIYQDKTEVMVKQTVKDLQGNRLFDGNVKHIYTFRGELVSAMEIEETA
jgi:nuclear transport factor 2 (NTF2) superfamily protein